MENPYVSGITLAELFDAYMENHVRLHCKRWRDTERTFANYLKPWGHRHSESIKRFEVQQLHGRLGKEIGPTTANRVVQLLRAMYNKSKDWELLNCSNPAIGITMFKLKSRERFLEVDELLAFAEAVETLRYETTRDFLWMCLYSAARRSNVACMRWEFINLERGTWYIPDTKNGTSQLIPLVASAIKLLRRRKASAKTEWVFASNRSQSGHLTKPENAWREIKRRSGIANFRIHDLRRTLASYEAMTGANISIIAKTLNHNDLKSTAIYARLQIDPVREAMEVATKAMFPNSDSTVPPELT